MIDEFLEGGAHATFAPSYSATWLNCAGSLLPSLQSPDIAGIEAAIGTVFHLVMGDWCNNEKRPDELYGRVFQITNRDPQPGEDPVWNITVDQEMFDYGQECWEFFEKFEGDFFVETRVDISDLTPIPDQFGTADIAFCNPGVLDIIDWKYGTGVQVFAKLNTQLLLYAWGFFQQYDHKYHFETIRMWIAQPRLDHWDKWEISRADLIAFAAYAKERAAEAWVPNAPRTPSPKACQWCRVQRCVALETLRQRLADEIFTEFATDEEMRTVDAGAAPDIVPPPELSTEHLAKIYAYRGMYDAWFAQIGEELVQRIRDGAEVRDWKVVEARTHRRWRDEQEAEQEFQSLGIPRDALYIEKMKSPNQSLKLLQQLGIKPQLRKEWLAGLVSKPAGRMTLVPTGDTRPEMPSADVDSIFDEFADD